MHRIVRKKSVWSIIGIGFEPLIPKTQAGSLCHVLVLLMIVSLFAGCTFELPTKVTELTNAKESSNATKLVTLSPMPEDEKTTKGSLTARTGQQTDVIVVGAGISGLSAALELGRSGARVTIIDMSSVFGGHAVMSQGSLSMVGTPSQERSGIRDSPDLAFSDFHAWGEDPSTEWVRYYVDNSKREIYDWLDDLGVRFSEVLASSGNTVAREHQPVGRGIGLVTPIYRACLELEPIEFVWNSEKNLLKTAQSGFSCMEN